jgi:hypothetical protein
MSSSLFGYRENARFSNSLASPASGRDPPASGDVFSPGSSPSLSRSLSLISLSLGLSFARLGRKEKNKKEERKGRGERKRKERTKQNKKRVRKILTKKMGRARAAPLRAVLGENNSNFFYFLLNLLIQFLYNLLICVTYVT